MKSLKNAIYSIFHKISYEKVTIREQYYELASIIFSYIQNSSENIIKKMFFSEVFGNGCSKQTYYENEILVFLKEYVKSFSEYCSKNFEADVSKENEINEEFEDIKKECIKIIEEKNLNSTNVLNERAFEVLKAYYMGKIKDS